MRLRGELGEGVLPGVLRTLYVERRTGMLHVTRAGERVSVCFIEGNIVRLRIDDREGVAPRRDARAARIADRMEPGAGRRDGRSDRPALALRPRYAEANAALLALEAPEDRKGGVLKRLFK